ncbi:MAG: UDP-3-O-(3-hydroxymyristoyl)glucosamine N-acyltransferase [bacterium]|nr:UDP-3-O-(3-hydroxymyristoyl)glucosamine N-acyltransferase [bacterium]
MQGRTLSQIARLLGGTVSGDGDLVITGLADLEEAGPGDLTFVAEGSFLGRLAGSCAGAVVLCEGMPADRPAIFVADAYAAFARLLAERLPDPDRSFPPGVHPTAVIDKDADVGGARSIGPYCVIGPGVALGRDCRLGPHVILGADVRLGDGCVLHGQTTLREGCILGDRVVIHPGCVIGSDGFGYRPGPTGMVKIPQVGIVQIEDDVEIGAGVTIDRATVGRTRIGAGSKIDNQVQIGHNVTIGRHCALSALTGIAGSTTLEDGIVVGGQAGIGDHLRIGAGARIGGKSGVWRDVPPGATLFGYPALDIKETFRITGAMRQLPDLIKRFRRLEKRVQASSEEE